MASAKVSAPDPGVKRAPMSQHMFRSSRRYAAIQRKDQLILQLQIDKLRLSGQIASLQTDVDKLRAEICDWNLWWEYDCGGAYCDASHVSSNVDSSALLLEALTTSSMNKMDDARTIPDRVPGTMDVVQSSRHWIPHGYKQQYPSRQELSEEAATCIQACLRGFWCRRRMAQLRAEQDCDLHMSAKLQEDTYAGECKRCGSIDCFCWQLFCRQCSKVARECHCESPLVRRRRCGRCSLVEDNTSPFDRDSSEFYKYFPKLFCCSSCGCTQIDAEDSPFYCLESAKVCGKCRRIGYHDIRSCEMGLACMGHSSFHNECLNVWKKQLLCDDCLRAATTVVEESGWPEFDEGQQRSFQSWYNNMLEAARSSILRARAETNYDSSGIQDMLERLNAFSDPENMRLEAVRFHLFSGRHDK